MTAVPGATATSITVVSPAIARDGLLPPVLARIEPRTATPVRLILVGGLLIATVAGFTPIGDVAELVNIGTPAAFFLVCAGVVVALHPPGHAAAKGESALGWATSPRARCGRGSPRDIHHPSRGEQGAARAARVRHKVGPQEVGVPGATPDLVAGVASPHPGVRDPMTRVPDPDNPVVNLVFPVPDRHHRGCEPHASGPGPQ